MSREPSLDDLIGTDEGGAELQRLQHVHDLLLRAGPPAELTPELEAGPTLAMTLGRPRRRVKPRALMLLAAALVVLLVFLGGYAVGNGRNGNGPSALVSLTLTGTSAVPHAQGSLEVWHRKGPGNWPMTLDAVGLPKLKAHAYYEVYLVRHGKLGGSCGTFRVTDPHRPVAVTLNSPYQLKKGDAWIVTRPGPGGAEPGTTVLRPITA